MSSKKKLICITGADGTGKSTLIENLRAHYPDSYAATIWDGLEKEPKLFSSKKEVDNHLCSISPGERLEFLYDALRYSTDKAMHSNSDLIFLNAYWYKYFAAELASGTDLELIKKFSWKFPLPDAVIVLELSPVECAKRKKIFSRYECGLVKESSETQFISFQEKTNAHWNDLEIKNKFAFDASRSEQELKNEVIKIIENK